MGLFRLIYVSKVARHVRFADVEAITQRAVEHNTENGLTGMLIYTPARFIQVLEGEESKIRETMERIVKDARHSEIQVVEERAVERREFAGWAMVARQLSGLHESDFTTLTAERLHELFRRAPQP